MKLLFAPAFCCLLLTGCFSDQRQQLARCQIEATTRNREPMTAAARNVVDGREVRLCMESHGYELARSGCPARFQVDPVLAVAEREMSGMYVSAVQDLQQWVAACYVPMGWMGRQSRELERLFGMVSGD